MFNLKTCIWFFFREKHDVMTKVFKSPFYNIMITFISVLVPPQDFHWPPHAPPIETSLEAAPLCVDSVSDCRRDNRAYCPEFRTPGTLVDNRRKSFYKSWTLQPRHQQRFVRLEFRTAQTVTRLVTSGTDDSCFNVKVSVLSFWNEANVERSRWKTNSNSLQKRAKELKCVF